MDLVIDDAASKCVILEVYESQADGDYESEGVGDNAVRDPPPAAHTSGDAAGGQMGSGLFCARALAAAAPVMVAGGAYAVYAAVARAGGGAVQQAG